LLDRKLDCLLNNNQLTFN